MTIEQKVKAYDEALEKARIFKEHLIEINQKDFADEMEYIFPELTESEDENIRKKLIKVCEDAINYKTLADYTTSFYKDAIAWLEKQGGKKSMKVYRVENEAEQKGLWRKFDGTWQPLFDMLTDGKCKDMPMEDSPIYREGGKRWFASAPSKEALQKWFSKRDLEELVSKGFTISEFEVVGYKKVSDIEYIFTRDNIINRNYLEVSDIYSEQKDFAPKIEPKFKVGDTMRTLQEVNDGYTDKVWNYKNVMQMLQSIYEVLVSINNKTPVQVIPYTPQPLTPYYDTSKPYCTSNKIDDDTK